MANQDFKTEDLGGGIKVCVSGEHSFGADAVLLAYFASPKKADTACDLCCGCGVIPLLWHAKGCPPQKAYAVDVQEKAYQQVRRSVDLSGLANVVPILADLRGDIGIAPGSLDLITCNPPYRSPDSGPQSKNAAVSAARHETMCTLGDVCATAKRLLRFGGRLCICHLPERLPDVFAAMRESKIEPKRLRLVVSDISSTPWLALVEGRLGGKSSLKVEAPLVMTENGAPSGEIRHIYGCCW